MSSGSDVPYRVGLVLIDDFALLSYASLTEPLRVANLLSGRELYRVSVLPTSGAMATSSGGVLVPANARIGDPIDLDLVIVVAAGNPFSFKDREVLLWLRELARRNVSLGGVSGGPVVLAEAGLMEGYRMTLHWQHAPALRERHPELVIERSLYVVDRERLSCAGGTAPLDLMHALLMRDQGVTLAREVSDWLQHTEIRPPGGAQRAGVVERYGVHLPPLIEALGAMETHVTDPLSLDDLAQIANVGARQLTRLFRDKLGTSPMALYRELRLEQGHRLLRQTDLCVGEVARATGFASAAHFASAYGSQYHHSPRQSRNHE